MVAGRPQEAGRGGAGFINACTFLGGSIGLAGGSIAYAAAVLAAVAGLVAALSIAAFVVCRRMPALGQGSELLGSARAKN